MKKILVMILALALCLSLCACGRVRTNEGMTDYETRTTERPGGTTDTVKNRSTGNGNGTTEKKTDMTPDAEDGTIKDDNADDGVIVGDSVTPSPNATHRP